jgi:hypothetical protein
MTPEGKKLLAWGVLVVGVLVAGVVFEILPAPTNPWLLIFTGLVIVLRPVALVGLVVLACKSEGRTEL